MSRRSCLVLAVASLSLGLSIGFISRGELVSSVEANALDRTQLNRLYTELDQEESALIESGRLLSKVSELTTPSVVHIQSIRKSRGRQVEETGSGVVMVSENVSGYFVVSNRHVVNGAAASDISIHLPAPDSRVLTPSRIWMDKDTDVAVLQVNATGLQPARWGNSDELEIGHMVLAMGSPFGLSQSVTYGIVSAKGRRSLRLGNGPDVLNQDFIQTDAAINPGNSGGPLIDMRGRVVGINTAIASNSGGNDGIGFSIPSNLAQKVMEQLLSNGRVRRAYLGVKLDPDFDAETAARFQLDRARGARVVEVYAQTPASRSNLMIDDVILKFDGKVVEDETHLINLVSLTDVNKTVVMEVLRNGRTIAVQVSLGDRTELEERSTGPIQRPAFEYTVDPMGFRVHELQSGLHEQLGLDVGVQGVVVTSVSPKAPFAGQLQASDVIESVGGIRVQSLTDFENAIQAVDLTKPVALQVRRRGGPEQGPQLIIVQPKTRQPLEL